jgi:hypothetical protein
MLLVSLAAASAVAVACLMLLDLPLAARLCAAGAILASSGYHALRDALLRLPASVLVVEARADGGRRKRHVLVLAEAVDADSSRRMRVWLRWHPGARGSAQAAG